MVVLFKNSQIGFRISPPVKLITEMVFLMIVDRTKIIFEQNPLQIILLDDEY